MIDTNNLLTAGEVAKKLKVTVQSVRLLIKNGMLNAERVGNQWLTSIEDLNEYIENLAIGISNLINIFEPEKILIGGGFTDYKEILLEPLKQQLLTGNLLFNKRNDIIIQLAKFKNDAGIIGATLI